MKWPLFAAAVALAATFARPTWLLERPRFEHVVVLDVTQSMNVQDEVLDGRPVSRLDAAKAALRHAVEALPCGSKVGWAIFTEYRSYLLFTPVEVCAHRAELRSALASIDGRMAWSGNSEIAKGLHSAIGIARQLPGTPSLVFVTDGHEAPPLDPNQRPPFDDKPGEVAGVIVGVGALKPSPIPKSDARGRPLGFWSADDVPQTHPHRLNRDLNGRRGRVLGMDTKDGIQLITAHVPMAELFTYATELRSLTAGRGTFSATLDTYEDVPAHIAEKVIEAHRKTQEAEEH